MSYICYCVTFYVRILLMKEIGRVLKNLKDVLREFAFLVH